MVLIKKSATLHSTVAPSKLGFLEYLEPSEAEQPPAGGDWAHEIKWDGYRAQAHLLDGQPTIFSRLGADWTDRFGTIAAAVVQLPAKSVIMDGEAVVLDEDGVSDTDAFGSQLGQQPGRVLYKAFDLLWLDGEDLRPQPWRERKTRLAHLLANQLPSGTINFVESLERDGPTIFAAIRHLGIEGLVSKRIDAPYTAGRSANWIKCKCAKTETLVVIGFGESDGHLDSLYLARRGHDSQLFYAGAAQGGFSVADLQALDARLRPLQQERPPLSILLEMTKVQWVRPEVLIEVGLPNSGSADAPPKPSYKRLRDDLEPWDEAR